MATPPKSDDPFDGLRNASADNPRGVFKAVERFGPLAHCLLDPPVVGAAHAYRPEYPHAAPTAAGECPLPAVVGGCPALGVWDGTPPNGCAAGFVLPFRWQSDQPSNAPSAFDELAEGVRRSLSEQPELQGFHLNDWHLCWEPAFARAADALAALNARPFRPQSAWAAVAGGLYLAAHGSHSVPAVMATGEWVSGKGVKRIDGWQEKLPAAARLGVRQVFVPEDQLGEAGELADDLGLTLGRLRQNTLNPLDALRDYLVALEAPPPEATTYEQLQQCAAYYHRLPLRSDVAAAYYWTHMLDEVARQARLALRNQEGPDLPRVTHLVTFASGGTELIPLAASILEHVKTVLVLHTDREPPSNVIDQLKEMDRTPVPKRVRGDSPQDEAKSIADHIAHFAEQAPREKLVLDITPGNSWQTVTADRAVRPGEWRFFLNPTYDEKLRRVIPGNEKPIVWRVK